MTAEIAVMNRHAVALAADSAVTIDHPRGPKIYNTVNKLFMLSKYAPVGVMVYGNASITGVPWETIIKEFRRTLGDRRFPTVEQYARELLLFLEASRSLFPREQQVQEIQTHSTGLFCMILDMVKTELAEFLKSNPSISESEIRQVVRKHVDATRERLRGESDLEGYPEDYVSKLDEEFSSDIDSCIDDVFEQLPLDKTTRTRLHELVGLFMVKDIFPNALSGVVVAGFGEDEHFPSLYSYDAQSVLLGKVKQRLSNDASIGGGNSASVVPFAQREMVDLFMTGVAPGYRETIEGAIEGFLNGMPDVLIDHLPIPEEDRANLKRRMRAANETISDGFRAQLEEYSRRNHVHPVVDAVALLPKEELAEMAESLVNLTSFRRRITMDAETVGGPIDVAVISKGDGFIWIRRKHYFKPDLNHHFFENYYR